jgi:hypothetical protein
MLHCKTSYLPQADVIEADGIMNQAGQGDAAKTLGQALMDTQARGSDGQP